MVARFPLSVPAAPARIAGEYEGDWVDRHGGGSRIHLNVDGTYVSEHSLCGYTGACMVDLALGHWTLRGPYVYVITTAYAREERNGDEVGSREERAASNGQPVRFLLYEVRGQYRLRPPCPSLQSEYLGPEAYAH